MLLPSLSSLSSLCSVCAVRFSLYALRCTLWQTMTRFCERVGMCTREEVALRQMWSANANAAAERARTLSNQLLQG